MRRGLGVAVVALLAVSGMRAFGADGQGPADANARLDDIRFGTYWAGQDVTLKDLKGKVVLLEIWGS